jgi:mono/diheme cytochrome c family protein
MRPLMKWVLRLLLAVVLLAVGGFAWFVLWPANTVPAAEPVDQHAWLDQGWGEAQDSELRQRYYYTPQGTSMPQGASEGAVRYDWFLNLERPLSKERFADPAHLRQYRFIVDPEPSAANPDHLPVGFTRHFDPSIGEYVLDITCAACHTGELHYTKDGRTTSIRIDGGQAMHALTDMTRGNFAPELLAALLNTAASPWKFDRFAHKVLGSEYPEAKPELKDALWATVRGMLSAGQNNPLRELYPVREGFGRTDALGRIGNTVFGDHLGEYNYQPGDAPVSYPYLWNIWKFDWVQYNGSVSQPLARNIGEALGVGAVTPWLSHTGRALPPSERFRSSVRIADLHRIEHILQILTPPRWPEELLGAIDQSKAARGGELFQQYCQECHGPHVASAARQLASAPLKPTADVAWRIEVIPLDHIGTDPNAAVRFIERRYDLSVTGLRTEDVDNTLRPLLVRSLARDAQFRLREVIRLREEEKLPLGTLPALLEKYPNPDANREATIPESLFREIDTALTAIVSPVPEISADYAWAVEPFFCGLNCHTEALLRDVRYGMTNIDRRIASLDVRQLSEGLALNLVGLLIKDRFYADYGIDYATQQCLEGFGALDLPQEIAGYKPRPLEGVWATPPFLHNGSVPSLYQMLLPPHERDQKFFVGRREFDPVHVGYVSTPRNEGDAGFWLDTSIAGNRNIGHGFAADADTWRKHRADPKANPLLRGVIGPVLTEGERVALVEYLKVHRDLPATPEGYEPPQCKLWGEVL